MIVFHSGVHHPVMSHYDILHQLSYSELEPMIRTRDYLVVFTL